MKQTELKKALSQLTGWTNAKKKISKKYVFKNFGDAFTFMRRCAVEIDKLDHHPEWFNVYNKVNVELTTHDAGDVTAKDIELAKIMDKLAARLLPKGK